jgi:putative ABC transport system permease protein
MLQLWLAGLMRRVQWRILGTIFGVAITVALLISLGSYISSSTHSLTRRAIAHVPVDWQIELAPGTNPSEVRKALLRTTDVLAVQLVGYAGIAGLSTAAHGTTQTTASGKALGIGSHYFADFPSELRVLTGSSHGVLLMQQTAANLHATVGDSISLLRVGLAPVVVHVDGIVDLPQADSLFQAVGLPSNAAPQAPPDNVVVLPETLWHRFFDRQASLRPDSVRIQLHVRISHALPSSPTAAYTAVTDRAKNLEARVTGGATVGNNLGAQLLSTQADALYASVLLWFLGIPGATLAAILTITIAAVGRRRQALEQALLRVRGASSAQILQIAVAEAAVVAIGGVALGAIAGWVIVGALGISLAPVWTGIALFVGALLALGTMIVPAWLQSRETTVVAARSTVERHERSLWERVYLDAILLIVAAVVFWQTANTGYQVVVAPEGVPQTSVQYAVFLAPFCLWLGAALLALRLIRGSLSRARNTVTSLLRVSAGNLAPLVAASFARQSHLLAKGVVLVMLAFSFALSTALFNTTYNAQSRVDAQLTNGADVTVQTHVPFTSVASFRSRLSGLPDVRATALMQHRLAYVGNDLQDFYGIDPRTLAQATTISNAFFANGNAAATLNSLATNPDGVLVSQETATTYELHPGDPINLRLQWPSDHRYHVVPFRFLGVVREFPTAPKDSFIIANADYVARTTTSAAASIALLRVSGSPSATAAQARKLLESVPGVQVTDIETATREISASLTSVSLAGLTALELSFAVVFVVATSGLILGLSFAERRRMYAILCALGARDNQLRAFLWSEGALLLIVGSAAGCALGVALAHILVAVLTGVFDPPPEGLAVPWAYIAVLFALAIAGTGVAVGNAVAVMKRSVTQTIREL